MTEKNNKQLSTIVISIDIKKAFDHVRRPLIISSLAEILPSDVYWVYRDLITNSKIALYEHIIPYNIGVPQGAILFPIMFAWYINSLLKRLKTYGLLLAAYADNIIIGLNQNQLNNIKKKIESWQESHNMIVQWHNSQTLIMNTQCVTKAQSVNELKYLGVTLRWKQEEKPVYYLEKEVKALIGNTRWFPSIRTGVKAWI